MKDWIKGLRELRSALSHTVGDTRAGKALLSLIEYGYANLGAIPEQEARSLQRRLQEAGLQSSCRQLTGVREECLDLRITL